jgi:hypothetical protein
MLSLLETVFEYVDVSHKSHDPITRFCTLSTATRTGNFFTSSIAINWVYFTTEYLVNLFGI